MTRDELTRIALRYDTAMSRAMLRALGVQIPERYATGGVVPLDTLKRDMYAGMQGCMMQRYGVAVACD